MSTAVLTATEFKAKCLDVFDRLARRELERVTITKRGRTVAVVTPPAVDAAEAKVWLDSMRGSVTLPEGVDLTDPILEDVPEAELGRIGGE